MEISEIKNRLSLSEVLHHYNLQPKNNMLKCFHHEDKKPSMQVNLEKNFYKCHSCGKTGDVIQFIEDFENLDKHNAILKAQSLIGSEVPTMIKPKIENKSQSDTVFLEKIFKTFRKGIYNSNPAKEYAEKRNLKVALGENKEGLEIGFNSGQFHHGERKDEELIKKSLEAGLLIDKGILGRTGEKAFGIFANKCLIFPLRNKENEIVSFYGRSIFENKEAKHFYLRNRSGIYPAYPKKETKKLILTEAIIDCASLLQIRQIKENYSLISCFGTNGLNEEILQAIKELKNLEEIIFCFDNDKAGKTAVEKYANQLLMVNYKLLITNVELPNKDINETLQLHSEEIFLELLENRKDIFLSNENKKIIVTEAEPRAEPKNNIDFLKQKNLLQELNKLIEKAGIIGEENSRLLLFLITISYLNKSPLHGIVQGSSGSGKTHIISRIADLMPQEDVLRFTRITESSLYNWGEFDLFQKIIIIEDLDGLKEDALYALREFISNQVLRSSVTIKDKKGNNKSSHKIVKGQFSSLSATTKGELYEDNMNRSFIIAINESEEQTEKIISYQNRRNAGEIDRNEQEKAIGFIQKLVRNLKHYEVVNPYATQIQLPNNVKNKRRLNEMFQSTIKQITLLHQYQREISSSSSSKGGEQYLVTEIEDVENAVEILFESIILKIDELDGSLRQFFEKLKKAFTDNHFTRFDAMGITGFKKTQLQFYLNELVRLEYLKQIGFANKGFKYKVSYSDNIQKVRKDLKEAFTKQLEELKLNATEHKRTPNGSETNAKAQPMTI
ncbi:CHC2 zinc finger domain-containing protein [Chryseobacterium suipulveris]|uniref:CHC2 zinc finger domain-containing protein n=1 Tax=Chryseobacterium suipulveris TaxID=2929800 RepID=A0ABY4BL27_9FLAO|nr:CHC2 zinc finger domain-containing protein [Chryseobacterium suipulveris]UOE39868.1 CHC2 zinc finger domain-containing protein [Chryseobacterium suipulveris]UOE39875.1 CHC2 zinc finger domain-containing protein [Chryseobacterium suipulveris]